jgi:hypothetical protein
MSEEQVTQESATETTEAVSPPTVDAVAEPTRPEGLPEKFNSWEDMAKSYSELESWKGKKEEDIRSALQQELETEAYAERPKTPGDYQVPESLNEEEAGTNPLLKEWAEYAWENGYSQDEFAHWVDKFAEYFETTQPNLEAIKTELGDNANARVESAQLFMNKFFPTEMHEAVAQLGTSAEGIKALEHIQRQLQGADLTAKATAPSQLSHADIESKMRDERYWNPSKRDKAFVQEVNNDFQKLYG